MMPRRLWRAVAVGSLVATALASAGVAGASRVPHTASGRIVAGPAAPYFYPGWGDPPDPVTVMKATGLTQFTLAFMLAKGTSDADARCTPAWNGTGSLVGNRYSRDITAIRKAGGDVSVSFGGANGPKLGRVCRTPSALAAAYEKVISTFGLDSIDVDIEGTEVATGAARMRELAALVLVRKAYPSLYVSVTFPTNEDGPDVNGRRLLAEAAADGFVPNAWTIMPFDFGRPVANMAAVTIESARGLARDVASAYGISMARAYRMSGISSMNGQTDETNETVTLANFRAIAAFAVAHHMARLTYWALNRDRSCTRPSQWPNGACSRIAQSPWAFAKLNAAFAQSS